MISCSPDDVMEIRFAICCALHDAFKNPAQPEPQLVANLVFEIPRRINKVSLSGTAQVSAGGVFVHSRPLVTCSSFPRATPESVEIGDLLLIRTLVVNKEAKEQRALLLQAKKVVNVPARPDNENQWHLYEQWPRFTYAARSGGLTGKIRRIKEPDMYDAAKYLLIGHGSSVYSPCPFCICQLDWQYCRPKAHTAQPTAPEIGRYRCFSDELVEFVAGNAGKVFVRPKARTRGWDRVIQDLISETSEAKSIFAGRAAGRPTPAMRGSGVLYYSLRYSSPFSLFGGDSEATVDNAGEPPTVSADWVTEANGRGISIIEFVVEQGEG